MKTLILGGVKSGKSKLAESLAIESGLPVVYVATATIKDEEMRIRINAHRERRPRHWIVVEEPVRLAAVLKEHADSECCILVDCLTLWLTNLLTEDDVSVFKRERDALLTVLPTLAGNIILVSNETNMGVTPLSELARRYCDEAGILHQNLARICDRVVLAIAGLLHVIKGD